MERTDYYHNRRAHIPDVAKTSNLSLARAFLDSPTLAFVSPTREREDTLRVWPSNTLFALVSPTREREDTLRVWPSNTLRSFGRNVWRSASSATESPSPYALLPTETGKSPPPSPHAGEGRVSAGPTHPDALDRNRPPDAPIGFPNLL